MTDNFFWEIADEPYAEDEHPAYESVIDTLSNTEYKTLHMRIQGLTFAEISDITGEPINRLLIRMHRIKNRLQKSIQSFSHIVN